ncbi:hypothetical protein J5X91_17795 [Pseudoalteromonas sp. K222D]|uniref:hypothetical protein n=1 Tax=Pseudoalteromonas sp. K222D TaxID=2820756 RepID=UPI001AD784D9|nr:hypothetical protein [Pseudoalteromonas sp. K222D]MBO7928090.1 hypothetical protein [Pseudoalteromonas sp. K222D]
MLNTENISDINKKKEHVHGNQEDHVVDAEFENVDEADDKEKDSGIKIKRPKDWRSKSYKELKEEVRKQFVEQGHDDVPDDIVEQIVDDITKDVAKRKIRQNVFSFVRLTLVASISVLTLSVFMLIFQTSDKFISKEELQIDITNAINKDIKLDDLKMVYRKQSSVYSNSLWPIVKPHLFYEKSSLTLITVLEDIKSKHLIKNSELVESDNKELKIIDAMTSEYNKINPFDGLDEQDIRDFKNISSSLSVEAYEKINDEIFSLTSSLKVKNNLINQYLNSSNLSLYISLSAFIFSVLVTLWQLLSSRRSSQKQLVAEAIKEHEKSIQK